MFGGLGAVLSGDFLQLPPVEEPSLALPLDDAGYARELDDATPDRRTDGDAARRERREFEHRGGFELWRDSFTTVTCLSLNMRTTGILAEILRGMRAGSLSDAAWHALQSRVLGNWNDADGNIKMRARSHNMMSPAGRPRSCSMRFMFVHLRLASGVVPGEAWGMLTDMR